MVIHCILFAVLATANAMPWSDAAVEACNTTTQGLYQHDMYTRHHQSPVQRYVDYLMSLQVLSMTKISQTNIISAQISVLHLHIHGEHCLYSGIRTDPLKYKGTGLMHFSHPCRVIDRIFDSPTLAIWQITVHRSYVINVTIYDAYVPYSDNCRKHFISLYEGINQSNETSISQHCGHVMMESMYTLSNKALFVITCNSRAPPHTVHLLMGYQLINVNTAYRSSGDSVNIPPGLHSNIAPSFMIHELDSTFYVWYIMADVLFVNNHPTKKLNPYGLYSCKKKRRWHGKKPPAYMSFFNVKIKNYSCTGRDSYIAVHRGLLPSRWIVDPDR